MPRACVLLPLVLLMLVLVPAAPAAALVAPEVFARDLDSAGMPVGEWQPLSSAKLASVNGEQLGYRLQSSGQPGNSQRVLVQVVSVPDGHPDQRDVYGLCFPKSGAAGTIIPLDSFTHYEGDGSYNLKFTASIGTDAATGCTPGPTTEGAFTVATQATILAIGQPLLNPLVLTQPFAGVEVTSPVGANISKVLCARDASVSPDGSLSGSLLHTVQGSPNTRYSGYGELYPEPGYWQCVSRGESENPGAWTAPTPRTLVQQDYRGLFGPYRLLNHKGPTYRLTAVTYPAALAAGGTVALTAAVVTGCTRATVKTRRRGSRTFRSRVDSRGRVSFRMRLASPRPGKKIILLLTSRLTGATFVRPENVQDLGFVLTSTGRQTRGDLVEGVC
jgi:hypothetical protein